MVSDGRVTATAWSPAGSPMVVLAADVRPVPAAETVWMPFFHIVRRLSRLHGALHLDAAHACMRAALAFMMLVPVMPITVPVVVLVVFVAPVVAVVSVAMALILTRGADSCKNEHRYA